MLFENLHLNITSWRARAAFLIIHVVSCFFPVGFELCKVRVISMRKSSCHEILDSIENRLSFFYCWQRGPICSCFYKRCSSVKLCFDIFTHRAPTWWSYCALVYITTKHPCAIFFGRGKAHHEFKAHVIQIWIRSFDRYICSCLLNQPDTCSCARGDNPPECAAQSLDMKSLKIRTPHTRSLTPTNPSDDQHLRNTGCVLAAGAPRKCKQQTYRYCVRVQASRRYNNAWDVTRYLHTCRILCTS